MSAVGITQDEIAVVLGLRRETLRKHYREELEAAGIEADAQVMGALFRMATSGEHPAAAIFWAKVRRGWREAAKDEGDGTVARIVVQINEGPPVRDVTPLPPADDVSGG
jgi:DNA-binding XRE family transcriptional regulator